MILDYIFLNSYGRAIAYAAQCLVLQGTVFMPVTASENQASIIKEPTQIFALYRNCKNGIPKFLRLYFVYF